MGGWAHLVDALGHVQKTSYQSKTLSEQRVGEKQEGANELLLRDEQGGGRKQKRHVPHHLFAQRLYSTLHLCLASLANYNFHGHERHDTVFVVLDKSQVGMKGMEIG